MSYAINATNDGWRAINSESDLLTGETYSDTQPVLAPSPAQLLAGFQQSAQTALSATDTTFARIQEAITLGLTTAADPSVIAWIEYRKALRAEVRATVVGTLATKPTNYPAGT